MVLSGSFRILFYYLIKWWGNKKSYEIYHVTDGSKNCKTFLGVHKKKNHVSELGAQNTLILCKCITKIPSRGIVQKLKMELYKKLYINYNNKKKSQLIQLTADCKDPWSSIGNSWIAIQYVIDQSVRMAIDGLFFLSATTDCWGKKFIIPPINTISGGRGRRPHRGNTVIIASGCDSHWQ